ncbi:hypothetical protein CPB83DRAFT_776476 [Crepidotus variabilis]|uniref:Uncharacterized protein n=1 Tax=Crepidotus variabilis TaxID=179855 RepID=A0A9P6JJA6_9AGAR|nr:hypothetical protein CPB83DRAFT_776476 [Crepidotus variabilis]
MLFDQLIVYFSFSTGQIFATAFATAVKAKSFHYTLSIMQDTNIAMKIHVKEPAPDHFVFEASKQTLKASRTLCCALLIGHLGNHTIEEVITLLKEIPLTLPDIDKDVDVRFRCRVFLKQCIRTLSSAGIVNCKDANAVVNGELRELAIKQSEAILTGTGAYIIAQSQISS